MYLTETFQTMPFGRPVSTPSLFPRFRPLLRSDHRGRRPGELFREAQRGSRRGRRWTDGRADEWFFIPATSYGDRPTDRPNATVAECDVRGVEWALERASRLVTHAPAIQPQPSLPVASASSVVGRRQVSSRVGGGGARFYQGRQSSERCCRENRCERPVLILTFACLDWRRGYKRRP